MPDWVLDAHRGAGAQVSRAAQPGTDRQGGLGDLSLKYACGKGKGGQPGASLLCLAMEELEAKAPSVVHGSSWKVFFFYQPAVLGNGRFKGQGTVQNGGLAERVSVEGAMLQYAVDVRLDEALSMLWHQGAMLQHGVYMSLDNVLSILWHQVRVQGGLVGTSLAFQVSQPPQPLNPFPKLMHIV
eukprot:scaffold39752_cov21-Tisochrysis_lutea.AAC.1